MCLLYMRISQINTNYTFYALKKANKQVKIFSEILKGFRDGLSYSGFEFAVYLVSHLAKRSKGRQIG